MPGIFISYRRDDAAGQAGRLYDHLLTEFGPDRVFFDSTLRPADHFAVEIERAITNSDVVLVVIGPRWNTARLDDPKDFVRFEIATALRLQRKIVPVTVEGASVPNEETLPAVVREFRLSHAVRIEHETFRRDVAGLIAFLGAVAAPDTPPGQRRLVEGLTAAGRPYRWFVPLVGRLGPKVALVGLGVLALCAFSPLVIAVSWPASVFGYREGNVAGRSAVAREWHEARAVDLARKLQLRGFIIDGVKGVEGLPVKVTNEATGRSLDTKTGMLGSYTVNLRTLDIEESAVIRLDASTPTHVVADQFSFRDGPELRSILRQR